MLLNSSCLKVYINSITNWSTSRRIFLCQVVNKQKGISGPVQAAHADRLA